MKILFIASIFPKENEEDNIYTDLEWQKKVSILLRWYR